MLKDRLPVLLFPVRLETRFMNERSELWVRIYPDDVAIESHESKLTVDEALAGLGYRYVVEFSGKESAPEEQRRTDAWRELVRKFSAERAAWIIKEIHQEKFESYQGQYKTFKAENRLVELGAQMAKDLGLETQELPKRALSRVLPDRFIVNVYNQEDRRIYQEEGKPISAEVHLMAPPDLGLDKQTKQKKVLEFFNEVQAPQDLRERVVRFFGLPEFDREKIRRLAQTTIDLRDAGGFRFQELADIARIWNKQDLDPEGIFDNLVDTLYEIFIRPPSNGESDAKEDKILEFFNETAITPADIVEPIIRFSGRMSERRAEIQRLAQQTIDMREAQFQDLADIERIWRQEYLDPDGTFDNLTDTLFGVFLEHIEYGNGMLGPGTRWLDDFETAVQMGLGVKVSLTKKGLGDQPPFSRMIAIGVKSSINERQSAQLLERLIDSHHYSNGLAFLKSGTATNNTEQTRSGYSEKDDEPEHSYNVEFIGHSEWDRPPREPRTNAERLGHALGLGLRSQSLQYIEGNDETPEVFTKAMRTALWPATGDYLLRYLMHDVLDSTQLAKLSKHVQEFVQPSAPLPTIRIDEQPYGILPVTSVRPRSNEHPYGWKTSPLDHDGQTNSDHTFDSQLHTILVQLHDQWLRWALDPDRVPRVNTTGDPDKELLQILAMSPVSLSYHTRPFVDERLVAWLLVGMRDFLFGEDTPYGNSPAQTPLGWVKKWDETWRNHRRQRVNSWSTISNLSVEQLEQTPLFRLFAWWNDKDLEIPFVRHIAKENGQETLDIPMRYLRHLCEGVTSDSKTLLFDLLSRALKLAPQAAISVEEARAAICLLVSSDALEFFNTVSQPEQIVRRIVDDPKFGAAPPRAYGIRQSVAKKILDTRKNLPRGRFESLEQIDEIAGVGTDTFHDIVYTFRQQPTKVDIDGIFRETLDLTAHRLDAWITSFATKRLHAMRRENPAGIYLGAYGWLENVAPVDSTPSGGYVHTPSTRHAAAAAVLHSAYQTHQNGNAENPFRINLNSERVRCAMHTIEGIRQEQPLGVLLGFQFERALQARKLDQYIDEFRNAFPLTAGQETEFQEGETIEAVAARNVVDGLTLAKWYQDRNRTDILRPDPGSIEVVERLLAEESKLRSAVKVVENTLDAVSDLLMCESVFQGVQGDFEKAGGVLEAIAGNTDPQPVESMATPVSGKSLSHRVCFMLPPEKNYIPKNPRERAEPRLAAWIAKLFGPLSDIGCRVRFRSARININEATKAELVTIPGIAPEIAQGILQYLEKKGPLQTFDALHNVPEIQEDIIHERLQRWGTVESRKLEDEPYERINVNHAMEPDFLLLGLSPEMAQAIIQYRQEHNQDGKSPFQRITNLAEVEGIDMTVVEQLRPWVTTGVNWINLEELNTVSTVHLKPIDLLYLSAFPPQGEETDIEQIFGYWARNEFGLAPGNRVEVDVTRPEHLNHGLEDTCELGRQLLNILTPSHIMYLRPDSLMLPQNAETVDFTEHDLDELQRRVSQIHESIKDLTDDLYELLTSETDPLSRSDRVRAGLFKAFQYGITGIVPSSKNDPNLEALAKSALSQLQKRLREYDPKKQQIHALHSAQKEQAIEDRARKTVELLVECVKALLGKNFVVLPTFVPSNSQELTQAFAQEDLLAGLGEERIRLWLQQAETVHPPLRDLENSMMALSAWAAAVEVNADSELKMSVAQLPFHQNNRWLGLSDEERGEAIHTDETTHRGVLSLVAVSPEPITSLVNKNGNRQESRVAGLVVQEWDELLPSPIIETSVAFQYNQPNSQPPQALLLAVPSQQEINHGYWHEDELIAIIKDTLDLAKVRAVDPDAMGEKPDQTFDDLSVGIALPALMLATDPEQPGWARNVFVESIGDWIEQIEKFETGCLEGTLEFPYLRIDADVESEEVWWTIQEDPKFSAPHQGMFYFEELSWSVMTSAKIQLRGDIVSASRRVFIRDYQVLEYPHGFHSLSTPVTGEVIWELENQIINPTRPNVSAIPKVLLRVDGTIDHDLHGGKAYEIWKLMGWPAPLKSWIKITKGQRLEFNNRKHIWIDEYEIVFVPGVQIPPTAVGVVFSSTHGLLLKDENGSEWMVSGEISETVYGGKIWVQGHKKRHSPPPIVVDIPDSDLQIMANPIQVQVGGTVGIIEVGRYGLLREKETIIHCI